MITTENLNNNFSFKNIVNNKNILKNILSHDWTYEWIGYSKDTDCPVNIEWANIFNIQIDGGFLFLEITCQDCNAFLLIQSPFIRSSSNGNVYSSIPSCHDVKMKRLLL